MKDFNSFSSITGLEYYNIRTHYCLVTKKMHSSAQVLAVEKEFKVQTLKTEVPGGKGFAYRNKCSRQEKEGDQSNDTHRYCF
jgi:hypothetical protein